ncbi:MAG: response regulator [Candidatus Moraniibacteriota bacterium]
MEKIDKKILIVEDDSNLMEILLKLLEREGFETFTAKDGEEGLRMALSERPDLILLDIVMPKKDGITMLTELRLDAWGKSAPVIFLTNIDATESMEEGLGKGALDYIVKSRWNNEDVIKKIKTRLECQ